MILKNVEEFEFLGAMVTRTGISTEYIKSRTEKESVVWIRWTKYEKQKVLVLKRKSSDISAMWDQFNFIDVIFGVQLEKK